MIYNNQGPIVIVFADNIHLIIVFHDECIPDPQACYDTNTGISHR